MGWMLRGPRIIHNGSIHGLDASRPAHQCRHLTTHPSLKKKFLKEKKLSRSNGILSLQSKRKSNGLPSISPHAREGREGRFGNFAAENIIARTRTHWRQEVVGSTCVSEIQGNEYSCCMHVPGEPIQQTKKNKAAVSRNAANRAVLLHHPVGCSLAPSLQHAPDGTRVHTQ